MKKLIAILFIIAAVCVACRAQSLVFENQTITVEQSQLSVESVQFQPLEIVQSTLATWETYTAVTTNGMFENYSVETNELSRQVLTDVLTTNAAAWSINVIFSLPAGHQWSLSGMPVTIERFKTRLQVPVSPSVVTSLLGAQAASGLEFAASNGAYKPTGQIKDAFLSLAAAVLAGESGE